MLNLVYRPPNGDHIEKENYFKSSLIKRETSHKDVNVNINLLDLDLNLCVLLDRLPARLIISSQTLCALHWV